jgi:hypothetical protein
MTMTRPNAAILAPVLACALVLTLSGCGKKKEPVASAPIPFQLTERNGAAALEFTNWTIAFEAIPARTVALGSTGVIALASATSEGGEYKFRGLHLRQFAGKSVNIISVNNYTFKLMASGHQVAFPDHVYEVKDKPKEILVARDGRTTEVGSTR